MKVLLLAAGLLVGAAAGFCLTPRTQIVEADLYTYVPVPQIAVACEAWFVTETGPDFYWDADSEATFAANYWTVETLGVHGEVIRSEPALRGETVEVAPSVNDAVTIVWWDSDRGGPAELNRVSSASRDCLGW